MGKIANQDATCYEIESITDEGTSTIAIGGTLQQACALLFIPTTALYP